MVGVATHSDESLDMGVPRRDVVVADRPIHSVTVSLGSGELILAPALTGAPPNQRLAADLIAADPVERLLLDVRVVFVLDEEVRRIFPVTGGFADQGILFNELAGRESAVRELPRSEI